MQKWISGPKSTIRGSAAGAWCFSRLNNLKSSCLVDVMASYVARNLVKSPAALGFAQQQTGKSSVHCKDKKMYISVQFFIYCIDSKFNVECLEFCATQM